jgi:hypothetical protein
MVFFSLALGLDSCDGRGQRKKPIPAGRTTKIPKVPVAINGLLGVQNNSRNTSREQPGNQTIKKYVILYSIVNIS